jgi:DNA helicase IV
MHLAKGLEFRAVVVMACSEFIDDLNVRGYEKCPKK